MVILALAASALPWLASAAEKPDVTITVVEDPKELKEKVNTISLPDAGVESHASQPAAKTPGGRARNDREDSGHDAAGNARSDSSAAKSDAKDAEADAKESTGKADD